MTNFKFAKVKDKPLNRDGETSEGTFTGTEGDVIGLTENADGETEVVAADADAAAPQPAIGVLLENVRDRSYWSTTLHDNGTMARQLDEAYDKNRTQPGDEVTYVSYGIYCEDVDGTVSFTPNEPVYLGVGGGVTQSPQADNGDIVQRLGLAVNTTTFMLDVDDEYAVAGDVVRDGDSTNGKTSFAFAHGLDSAPDESDVDITPTSADAAGDFYIITDATDVTVEYVSAPADGTGNVTFDYVVQA